MVHEPPPAAVVVLHEERVQIQTERVAVRAVLRRRVVTEVRRVEVTVQREVLEVEHVPLDGEGAPARGQAHAPLELVLSEQVPVVHLETRPYERIVADVESVTAERSVETTLGRETAEVEEVSAL